ncbi:hypothetical protein GH714_004289 [Hevea brasiliensis]|uniref:Rx N-terminal domain-containing protein n=1 Tax=Hevea brasiliensis TaxID=3981 RepID=A0A6A6KYS8_HEVBR|nr:hypothetical protein GH714_004289 [Hevea brasiliensis]
MADMIVSAAIDCVINKLTSSDLLQSAGGAQVQVELEKMVKTLSKVKAVLADAEDKQITNRLVKIWLRELRDLAYDAEDILDEFSFEVLRRKQQLEQRRGEGSSSKVWSVMLRFLDHLNPHRVLFNMKMKSEIETINAKFQELIEKKNSLELRENGADDRGRKSLKRLPTSSLVDERVVCGRAEEKEKIIQLLLSGERCDDRVCVIPVVGMGGVGKTTLSQIVYNDSRVVDWFDLKVWCCVSEDFDVVRVTKTILDAITMKDFNIRDLNLLQVALREQLRGKRYLIVLDDVWSEKYEDWIVLRQPFLVGSPGSKIIVTTRNHGVAAIMGRRNFDGHLNLKKIGEKIVRKCGGLPLAVKTLGSLLHMNTDQDEWESVLNSKIWHLPEDKSGILPALRLSYYYLPSHLKPLFAFCSIFPKNYEFYQDELVLLWMAEGFLPELEGKKQMEELDSYFNELLSRSLFQRSSIEKSKFVMHDLINDLAQTVAGEICMNLNDKFEGNKLHQIVENARHFSFIRRPYEVWNRFEVLGKMNHLRTFVALPIHTLPWACCYLSKKVLHDVLPKLRCLRVLSLSGYQISELPDAISSLKHLRYLNMSCTKIKWLPESLSTLLYLETLLLYGCTELTKLPQGIGNLINLCHLDITDTHNLHEMPLEIGNLTNLQTLSKFIVGEGCGYRISELKDLKHLQGKLSIMGLNNVADGRHAFDANIRKKHNLVELGLEWSRNFHDLRNKECEMQVLNLLKPCTSLRELSISFYGGAKFPLWIGDPSFAKLSQLKLSCCRHCTSLPSFGKLPLLRNLCIEGMDAVKTVDFDSYGEGSRLAVPFPSLETLKFEDMLVWELWLSSNGDNEEPDNIFPRLSELALLNCPKLTRKLPKRLCSLAKLTICNCPILENSLISLPSLHELKLEECSRLTFLWNQITGLEQVFGLERIIIKDCPQLVSLTENANDMLYSCARMELSVCNKEEQLPYGMHGLQSLKVSSPVSLNYINNCSGLRSFPEVGLSLPNLRTLNIYDCFNLKTLPGEMRNLMSLQELAVCNCPGLVSFPQGDLLPNLMSLEIWDCGNIELSMSEWNFQSLTHLRDLSIAGGCFKNTVSFPNEKCLLPPSLMSIYIGGLPNLESLSMQLQSLTSIEELEIVDCPKLQSLPSEGLPPTLGRFSIRDCPLLKQQCFPKKGMRWPLIVHIPCMEMDGEDI